MPLGSPMVSSEMLQIGISRSNTYQYPMYVLQNITLDLGWAVRLHRERTVKSQWWPTPWICIQQSMVVQHLVKIETSTPLRWEKTNYHLNPQRNWSSSPRHDDLDEAYQCHSCNHNEYSKLSPLPDSRLSQQTNSRIIIRCCCVLQ